MATIKQKKVFIPGAIGAVLIIFAVVFFLLRGGVPDDSERVLFPVYFFNAEEGRLVSELREMPQRAAEEGEIALITGAFHQMYGMPYDGSLMRAVPWGIIRGDYIVNMALVEGVLTLDILRVVQPAGRELVSPSVIMTPVEEVILRSAVTLTMLGLPYVDSVEFIMPDGETFTETSASIANAPFISPARRTAETFTLFFVCESGDGLFTKVYEATYVNSHMRERYIMEQLIVGQQAEGVMPLIPPETQVRDASTESDVGIYVNLSAEFSSRFNGNAAQARLMLQSIAHTMIENSTLRHVFFLIESDRQEEFHGVPYFNLRFTIDETAMACFVPPEPYEEE